MTHRERLVMRLLDAARRLQGCHNWTIGLPKDSELRGPGNDLADVLDEIRALPAESYTRPEAAWKTIDTAPLGKMVWLWHRAWRHPFPGQCINHETGMSVMDTCTTRATTWDTHATHWREMDLPLAPQSGGKPE